MTVDANVVVVARTFRSEVVSQVEDQRVNLDGIAQENVGVHVLGPP